MNDPLPETIREQHRQLTRHSGYCRLDIRCQVELTGGDRAAFLHNLCTNEIKKLEPGRGCEAFLCNVQGKIVGYVFVFCTPDSLVLESTAGQNLRLMEHLDRYLIREDVTLTDRTTDWSEWLLAGPEAPDVLRKLGVASPPDGYLEHAPARLADTDVFLRRTDWTGDPAWFIAGERRRLAELPASLESAGARPIDRSAVEIARVERGSPVYEIDISEKNLPQEVDRNEQAISFVKGCYLGQETVARIDALGHVNWTLCGLRGEQSPLDAGQELRGDGGVVARVTSSVYSPRLEAPFALAYVRRGHETPGTVIDSQQGQQTVIRLPLGE